VGIDNYVRALTADDLFWTSLGRTFKYAVIMVPTSLILSLSFALLLNQGMRAMSLYRTLFFLPSLTPAVASALLWTWFFQPQLGPLNYLLRLVGIEGPSWLGDMRWAMVALIIMALWGSAGGGTMVIFLAGLQGIPKELYDAAVVDGAGRWHKLLHITLPILSPTVFFNMVLGIIGALKVFTPAFIATHGGPAYATWFYLLHLYFNAFQYFEMGYASALAWLFFCVVVLLTYLQFRWSRQWVYYEGELRQ
jgi:multiple sugar transport system permease protein